MIAPLKFILFCIVLNLMPYTKASSQTFSHRSKWLILVTKTMDQKGKSEPPPQDKNLKLNSKSVTAWQFGLIRQFAVMKSSYINIGLNYGWTNYFYESPALKPDYFPEIKNNYDYSLIGGGTINNVFDYWAVSFSFEGKIKKFKKHSLFYEAGFSIRQYYPCSYDGWVSDNYPIYQNKKWLNVFEMDLLSSNDFIPDFILSFHDYIHIKNIKRIAIGFTAHYCPINCLSGTYSYFPDTQSRATGKYTVSGSFIGISIGYMFNFKKKNKQDFLN